MQVTQARPQSPHTPHRKSLNSRSGNASSFFLLPSIMAGRRTRTAVAAGIQKRKATAAKTSTQASKVAKKGGRKTRVTTRAPQDNERNDNEAEEELGGDDDQGRESARVSPITFLSSPSFTASNILKSSESSLNFTTSSESYLRPTTGTKQSSPLLCSCIGQPYIRDSQTSTLGSYQRP